MPLKLCQGKLSCGNFAAIEIGTKLLCVPHAATQDLGRLLREKTLDQLNHLALAGCGELPPWARCGISRGVVQGPEPKRGRGRPRKWLNANQRCAVELVAILALHRAPFTVSAIYLLTVWAILFASFSEKLKSRLKDATAK
jgi:hypothetical protein